MTAPDSTSETTGAVSRAPLGEPGHVPAGVGGDDVSAPAARPSVLRIIGRLLMLAIAAVALYGLAPQLVDMWDSVPRLSRIAPLWFAVMLLLMAGSYASVWWLTRVALPQVSWFVAGTSQLVSNAVAKAVPGGAAMGAAAGYRMLAVSGVNKGTAGAALTATSIISNGVLLMLPLAALLISVIGAPVPRGLDLVAYGGAALFIMLLVFGFLLVKYDRPLLLFGRSIERVAGFVLRRLHRTGGPTAEGFVQQRDLMVAGLGARWKKALLAAVGNWLLDYFALVAALMAVGVSPRFSVVLLAFGAAAVLGMIPITPGGLGFVEAGLTAMLVVAGVPSDQALLATLAYRIVSYWLPLPAGLVAHLLFRHRYGRTELAPA
ncbi:lysylphosphatidylglycerol synthase transmembrane domain-containing protein [Rhabdothermincola salaria]|uniref:lysylphosphatidylglycerol synthase transmembrane domain-containing protein n=1 Tax=Rhabdothermincola salaria TaxID=2903142 RepID=UPI001E29ED37|nr:flippase-like domain-containing protein [Rhabdothermincola salaria]